MVAAALGEGRRKEARRRACELAAVLAALLCGAPVIASASDCPPETQVRVPQAPPPPFNIDKVKEVLLVYQAGDYDGDCRGGFRGRARLSRRPRRRGEQACPRARYRRNLAVELGEHQGQQFRFHPRRRLRPVAERPMRIQGLDPARRGAVVKPALDLFNAAKAKGVAVFFITGRRDSERQATLWNLDRAGFEGWEKLVTRPDDDAHTPRCKPSRPSSAARLRTRAIRSLPRSGISRAISTAGSPSARSRLPNPFYFIP